MSSPSDEYELFIASLIDDIKGTHRQITDLRTGRKNTITGVSGQPHQIDVSFVDHDFDIPTLVIIECKRFTRRWIKLEHVKVLKATLDDILAARHTPNHAIAIIVTTKDAQQGAQRFADYYEIRIERVLHGPNYSFRYENIIQAGLKLSVKTSISVENTLLRQCRTCGEGFEVQENEKICPKCASGAP